MGPELKTVDAKEFVDHAFKEFAERKITLKYWLTYDEIGPVLAEHLSRRNVSSVEVSTTWESLDGEPVPSDVYYAVTVVVYGPA